MRWAGNVARMEDMRNAYNILLEDLKGREDQLERHRRRWKDNIKMAFKNRLVGCGLVSSDST
jgi:hypothetical protein